MAGYTDRAMRVLCHKNGADFSVTEMVSAKATVFADSKTALLSRIKKDEGKVAVQIFGSEPDVMARAAAILSKPYPDVDYVAPVAIDVNMGCPVHKIFSNGEGSALMKDPGKIYSIVKAITEATDLPVTVKLRSGTDSEHINAVDCALAAESAGAELVCIHGRTRSQLYGGSADKDVIKSVKAALRIPVLANGDIVDAASALEMLKYTGADGIMIGRAAVGNPFIFSDIKAAMANEEPAERTINDMISMAIYELALAVEDKGERIAIPEARKKIALYFKGFRGSASLRARINAATTFAEVSELIRTLSEA